MKLASRRTARGQHPVVLLDDGQAVDLEKAWPARYDDPPPAGMRDLLARGLDRVVPLAAARDHLVAVEPPELGPTVPDPAKILCVGLNYRAHASESSRDVPAVPEIFVRVPRSLAGPFDPVRMPLESAQLDWEGELAVIIGGECRRATPETALRYVAGYAVFNDISVRDWQLRGLQWGPGKNFDGTGPLGPALVTGDEFDPAGHEIITRVNGETVQAGNTSQMIFTVPELIVYCSSFTTLEPGDVIATGTPSGVGFRREPPRFLSAGDTVEVEIDGIGRIANQIVEEDP